MRIMIILVLVADGCSLLFSASPPLAMQSKAKASCYKLVFCSAYCTRNVHTEHQYPGMARGLDGHYPLRVAVCRKGRPSRVTASRPRLGEEELFGDVHCR